METPEITQTQTSHQFKFEEIVKHVLVDIALRTVMQRDLSTGSVDVVAIPSNYVVLYKHNANILPSDTIKAKLRLFGNAAQLQQPQHLVTMQFRDVGTVNFDFLYAYLDAYLYAVRNVQRLDESVEVEAAKVAEIRNIEVEGDYLSDDVDVVEVLELTHVDELKQELVKAIEYNIVIVFGRRNQHYILNYGGTRNRKGVGLEPDCGVLVGGSLKATVG